MAEKLALSIHPFPPFLKALPQQSILLLNAQLVVMFSLSFLCPPGIYSPLQRLFVLPLSSLSYMHTGVEGWKSDP